MKRVVLVTSSMKMGGLNSVIEEHAQLFLSAGLDVSVVLLRRGGEVPSGLQGRVHYMPKIDSNSVFYLRILYALFRPFLRGIGNLFAGRRNARIFHEFLEESGVEADDLVAIHGFRTIAALRRVSHPRLVKVMHELQSMHVGWASGWMRRLRFRLIRNCYQRGRLVAVSEAVKRDFRDVVGGAQQVTVISNGIDVQALWLLAKESETLALSRPYIVSVGRLVDVKGFDILINAYAASSARESHDLVIVGEGKQRPQLEALVCELGLEHRVHLTGYVKPPFGIVKNAALYVGASFHEGFGLALLEAMCLGVPVLASRVSGFEEIMENYPDALFRAGDQDDLRRHLDAAMMRCPGQNQCIPTRYNFSEILQSYLRL